jgi:MFS family permease
LASTSLTHGPPRAEPPKTGARGRDIWILTACQFFYYVGTSVDLTLTAIVGLRLAPTVLLATAPLAAMTTVSIAASYLAGILSVRFGQPIVLATGALVAVAGGLVSVRAVQLHEFGLLCVGTGMVGLYKSTGGYIRYLAADRAAPDGRERAVSTVLVGGVAAAIIGPIAATASSSLFPTMFAGSYLLVSCSALPVTVLVLVLRSRGPGPVGSGRVGSGPAQATAPKGSAVRVRTVARTADFRAALTLLVICQGVMTLMMAMGPLANAEANNSMDMGTVMIQLHLVGMFAPSLVSGRLVVRWGPRIIGIGGLLVLVAGTIIGSLGTAGWELMAALGLIGVGWNFMYVAGTAFAVRCYPQGRGGRVQAVMEGVSNSFAGLASLSASTMLAVLGWPLTNGIVTALLIAGALFIGSRVLYVERE